MIVNEAIVPNLALGTSSRQLQEEDSRIVVPAIAQPILPFFYPHALLMPDGTQNAPQSYMGSAILSRTNQAAALINIGAIPAGLYSLQFFVSLWFNFTGAAGTADEVSLELRYGGAPLAIIYAMFAQIGQFGHEVRRSALLREITNVDVRVPLTGVTESLNIRVAMNAIRHL